MKTNEKTAKTLCAILCALLIVGCTTTQSTNDTQVRTTDLGPMFEEGTGRDDITLAILRPRGVALSPDQEKYLDILQGALINDFNKFSAIKLFDSKNIERILDQQQLSMSGYFSETEYIRIGELLNAKFILVGTLTRIESQFDFDLSLTEVETGLLYASFKKTITLREIVNSSASRAVVASMLPSLNVVFTPDGILALETELSGEETESQNALALSYEAARSGNLIDALIYSYVAEDADKNSITARQQASEIFAQMGGSGTAIKEDIKRQEYWKNNLIAFEDFYRTHPPFELVYTSIDISKGITDYDRQTTAFDFYAGLRFKGVATMQKVLNDILKELRKTDYRKRNWGFNNWPKISATSTSKNQIHADIFNNYKTFKITAALLNDNNEVIANLEFPLYGQLMLSGQSTIRAFSTQERHMTITVPNDVLLRTDNIYFRVIGIDDYDADTANINNYVRNSVVAKMPLKNRITISADNLLIPELPEDRVKREEAAAKKSARENMWNTKKLKNRGSLSVGVAYALGSELKNPFAIESVLSIGFKNFSIDGRLVVPIQSNAGDSILGIGGTVGYSYVWNYFMASLGVGATWYKNIRDNSSSFVMSPSLEARFDIVPWKPGLGLRLGYKLEFGTSDADINKVLFEGSNAKSSALAAIVYWF